MRARRRASQRVHGAAPERPGVTPRSRSTYVRFGKPAEDWLLALVLAVVLAPAALAVAVAVLVSLGRPVIYRQTRVGRHGREFTLYKFRSMLPDRRLRDLPFDGPDRRVSYEVEGDPRQTRLGRLLRSVGLDEIPQLWNVIRGDMSLVGPRPEVPAVVARYAEWERTRHDVRPGLTGLWQVTARRAKPMSAHVAIDIEYVRRVSLWLDLRILARTLPSLMRPPAHRPASALPTVEAPVRGPV